MKHETLHNSRPRMPYARATQVCVGNGERARQTRIVTPINSRWSTVFLASGLIGTNFWGSREFEGSMFLALYAAVGHFRGNWQAASSSMVFLCLTAPRIRERFLGHSCERGLGAGHVEDGASCPCGTRPRVGRATLSRVIDGVVVCRTQARHTAGF